MNIEIEIIKALVEMVRLGGTYAIIGVFGYMLMSIVKIAVTGGLIWGIIRTITNSTVSFLRYKLECKATNFQAFSDKASEHILSALSDFKDTSSQTLKDLENQLKNLKEKYDTITKTTASQEK